MGEVVTFNDVPANDIPRMLREAADRIENGEHGEVNLAAFVIKTETEIGIFGWGELGESTPELYTILGAAQILLLQNL